MRTGEHLQVLGEDVVARLARQLPTDLCLPDPEAMDEFRSRMAELLGDVARVLADRIGSAGAGLSFLVGDGLEALTNDQLTALLLGLSALLGRPMVQNSDEELVVSVLDQRPADVETARGYRTNGRMLMHTDPTDVAGLLCLRQSATGGANVYASATAVHDMLTDQDPLTLHEYYRMWGWDLRGMQRPGADPMVATPVFSSYDGELSCRYGSLMLREGARGTGGLSVGSTAALDLFEQVAQRPELTLRYTLRRGESVWINNYRVLHGREAFEDRADAHQVRHLLRTWVWLHERPSLAPCFTAFSAAIDRG